MTALDAPTPRHAPTNTLVSTTTIVSNGSKFATTWRVRPLGCLPDLREDEAVLVVTSVARFMKSLRL